MNRLADLRVSVTSIDEAKNVLAEIARLTCNLAIEEARAEKRIAEEKARFAERTQQAMDELKERELSLKTFISTHKNLFVKPRKICTEFGSFGLQEVSELEITDEARLIKYCIDKVVRTPVKANIKQRIEDGQKIPGCSIKSGDTAVYKVNKSLIDAAVEDAKG